MKYVDHEIHIVEQYPPALCQPFHMMGLDPSRREGRHEVLRHSPHVGVGRSRNDHEVVGGGGQSPEIQYYRIDCLTSNSASTTRASSVFSVTYSFTTVTCTSGAPRMDLDPDLVFTQLANRLREIDLALVYFNASSSSLRWMSLA